MRGWRAILTGAVIGGTLAGCGSGLHSTSGAASPATTSGAGATNRPSGSAQRSGSAPAAGGSAGSAVVYLQSSAPVPFTGDVVKLTVQEAAGAGAPRWIRVASATVRLGDGHTASASEPCTGTSLPSPEAGLVVQHAYQQTGAVTAQVTALTTCGKQGQPDLTGAAATMRVLPSAPAASASWPRCGASQIQVTATGTGAGLGHIGVLFTLRNASSMNCRLYGYPGLLLLDARGQALPTTVVRAASGAYLFAAVVPHWVALQPGAVGSFDLQYGDNPVGAQASQPYATACPTASQVEVTLPDAFDHAVVPADMAPCGGQVLVSPVVPGSQWLEP